MHGNHTRSMWLTLINPQPNHIHNQQSGMGIAEKACLLTLINPGSTGLAISMRAWESMLGHVDAPC